MLKAIAIDDEPVALEVIKSLSAKIPFIQLDECFTDAFKALAHLQKQQVDLLFLDIKMPDISGIEFLRSIPNPPMIIFTTAYSEHAVQSFELDAIDYILKPFSLSRFLKACNKANEQYQLKHNHKAPPVPASIFVKSGYGQIKIMLGEILYVQSSGNYMQFVLPGQKVLSRLTMAEVESLLPPAAFMRVHRSYIVAKVHITRIEKEAVWINETSLPMGAAYAKEVERNVLR